VPQHYGYYWTCNVTNPESFTNYYVEYRIFFQQSLWYLDTGSYSSNSSYIEYVTTSKYNQSGLVTAYDPIAWKNGSTTVSMFINNMGDLPGLLRAFCGRTFFAESWYGDRRRCCRLHRVVVNRGRNGHLAAEKTSSLRGKKTYVDLELSTHSCNTPLSPF